MACEYVQDMESVCLPRSERCEHCDASRKDSDLSEAVISLGDKGVSEAARKGTGPVSVNIGAVSHRVLILRIQYGRMKKGPPVSRTSQAQTHTHT